MAPDETFRYEFVNDDVFVLDSDAGVVHRLTGESAEAVRAARDEVSRRHAIKLSLATGVGVVTMLLPAAAAASSGPGGGGGGITEPTEVALDEPTGVTVTVESSGRVRLSWTAVSGATSYSINYRVSGSGDIYTSTSAGSSTSGVITGLGNESAYEFTVTASAVGKTSATSSPPVEATPTATPPGTPTAFAGVASGGTVNLSWIKGGGPVPEGYTIRYGTSEPYSTSAGAIDGVTTAVSISGLTTGQTYRFYIKAASLNGDSEETFIDVFVPNLPATPNDFVAAKGDSYGEVLLTWQENLSEGAPASYTIEWKESTSGAWAGPTTGLTGNTYTTTNLTGGTIYDFRIKAVNGDGSSNWVTSSAAARNTPGAPTSATATTGDRQATVQWSEPAPGAGPVSTYKVEYRLASGTDDDYVTSSENATSPFTVSPLTGGATYVFRVSAVNTDGSSSTTTNSVTTQDTGLAPSAPLNVAATVAGTTVTVTWGTPVPGPSSYTLDYRHAGDPDTEASYTLVSTSATSGAQIANLIPGSTYVFRVAAVSVYGSSSASSSSTYVENPPSNPLDVTATPTSTQVVLSWSAPAAGGTVASYTIVHGPVGGSMTTVTNISAATTSQTYTGLTNGTSYQYTITALGTDGSSSSGHTTYAVPVTTNQTTFASVGPAAPISALTTSPTAASLKVDSDGTGYEYQLDGGTAVSISAGSTTSIALTAASHTLVVRKTLNNAQVQATVTLTKQTYTGSTTAGTTLFIPKSPSGPRSVSLDMYGGYGGRGGNDNKSGGTGGAGGRVSGTFAVLAGDNLQFAAGTGGAAGSERTSKTDGGAGGINPLGGVSKNYSGGLGGRNGDAGILANHSGAGGGGGAASLVIYTSGATTKTIVAAGGGGGGGGGNDSAGGNGNTAHSAVGGGGTKGGDGADHNQSWPGPGAGAGGGGAVGGAGGSISGNSFSFIGTQTNEGQGQGGRIGTSTVDSVSGLTAATATGGTEGQNGTLTLVLYTVEAITTDTVVGADASALGALTPVTGTAPAAAGAVTALSGNRSAYVDWSAVTGATDYVVYYRVHGTTAWRLGGTTTDSHMALRGLVNETRYEFAVRTRRGSNTSALSTVASATVTSQVTATPVAGATTTLSLATFTLDNLLGCTYTYEVDDGTVTGATGTTTFTVPLSGASRTVRVTKGYYNGTAPATITKTVSLTYTTNSGAAPSYPVPSGTYGPRQMSVELYGGKGGRGDDSGSSGTPKFTGAAGSDPGLVAGTFTVQAGDSVAVTGANGGTTATNANAAAGGTCGNAATYFGSATAYAGGTGMWASNPDGGAGGGGGAGNVLVVTRSGTTSALAVAGGGGGGGGAAWRSDYPNIGWHGESAKAAGGATNQTTTTTGGTGYGNAAGVYGGGGGGGGGANGGKGGLTNPTSPGFVAYGGSGDQVWGGGGGYAGANSVTGLATVTTNGTKTGLANSANGAGTLVYYTVSGAA